MNFCKNEEDQIVLKNQYYETILAKHPPPRMEGRKIRYDWEIAEVSLIKLLPEDKYILLSLIRLQELCQEEPPHFYTYFFVRKCLESRAPQRFILQQIKSLTRQLEEKNTSWHKIMHLIKLREGLLKKLQVAGQKGSQFIHDLRFVNLELIQKILGWKKENSCLQKPIFIVNGSNYLIKMLSDNTEILERLNRKKFIYLSQPNPFFLTNQEKDISNMAELPQQQIQDSMKILAKQKANELKLILQPPEYFIGGQNHSLKELEKLKQQLEKQKTSSQGINVSKLKSSKQENIPRLSLKNHAQKSEHQKAYFSANNKLQRMIHKKQVVIVKTLKKSEISKKQLQIKKNSVIIPQISTSHCRFNSFEKLVQQNENSKKKEPQVKLLNLKNGKSRKQIQLKNENNFRKSYQSLKSVFSKSKQLLNKNGMLQVRRSLTTFTPPIKEAKEEQLAKQIRQNNKRKSNQIFQINTQTRQKKRKKNPIDHQLLVVKNKLKEIQIKKLYGKNSYSKKLKSSYHLENLKEIQVEKNYIFQKNSKSPKKIEKDILSKQQKQKQIEKYDALDKKVLSLLDISGQNELSNYLDQDLLLKQKEKENKIQQLSLLKERVSHSSAQLENNLKFQQRRYIELKEQQYKLYERELQNKYEKKFKQIKEQYLLKNRVLQEKIKKQEQISNQNAESIMHERQKMDKMKIQLSLRKQILLETQKIKELKDQAQHSLYHQLQKQRIKQQIFPQIEKQAIESIENSNKKLMELFQETRKKNEKLQKQNSRKLKQINQLTFTIQQEQSNYEQSSKQQFSESQDRGSKIQNAQKNEEEQNQIEQIQLLKFRVKQQILRQMMKWEQVQVEEQTRQKLQRIRKKQQIEEQLKRNLMYYEQQIKR